MSKRASLRSNLSYVLHEPSGSEQVSAFARQIEQFDRRRRSAVHRLGALTDAELMTLTVVNARGQIDRLSPVIRLLSVSLGAWELLERVACVWFDERGLGSLEGNLALLDDPSADAGTPVTFFRAAASLHLPHSLLELPAGTSWWFGALVFQPRNETLLLEIGRLDAAAGTVDSKSTATAAIGAAEAAIRTHVGQWCCRHPLWAAPAEETLPEFGIREREDSACGLSGR